MLGNPPYTRYNRLLPVDREHYADRFSTAHSRFALYVPFFDQALDLLRPDGWLTFILPFKALTRDDTDRLRDLLRRHQVGNLYLLPEPTFDRMVTTILVTVKRVREPTAPSPLWLDHIYGPNVRSILKGLGVRDVEGAAEDYFDRYESHRETVKAVENREPHCQSTNGTSSAGGPDHEQAALSEWS